MTTFVLATHNRDKIREFREKLGSKVELKTLDDFPEMPDVIEDGETLPENARKKAVEIHAYTGLPAIADDTGLEVDALDGAPGVYSSRYAGEDVTYAQNVDKLLKEMKNIPLEQRSARFRTSIAFVDGDEEWQVQGCAEGLITEERRTEDGFGYDPVFYYIPLQKTFAELDLNEKNRISHRGKAISALLDKLKETHRI